MKKLWILETKITKDNLFSSLEIAKNISEDLKKKKIDKKSDEIYKDWSIRLETESEIWIPVISCANYFTFTSNCKKFLKTIDNQATSELKESLGEVTWSEEVKQSFKDLHNKIKSQYRVGTSEVEDTEKNYWTYKTPTENLGVYSYLWNSRNGEFKGFGAKT